MISMDITEPWFYTLLSSSMLDPWTRVWAYTAGYGSCPKALRAHLCAVWSCRFIFPLGQKPSAKWKERPPQVHPFIHWPCGTNSFKKELFRVDSESTRVRPEAPTGAPSGMRFSTMVKRNNTLREAFIVKSPDALGRKQKVFVLISLACLFLMPW